MYSYPVLANAAFSSSDNVVFDLLSIRGNRGNLLFAAVQNISSNRCFHGSTVFRRFLTVSMATQVLQGRDFADLIDSITVV